VKNASSVNMKSCVYRIVTVVILFWFWWNRILHFSIF